MNQKRPFRSPEPHPVYYREAIINATGKNYVVTTGTEVTLTRAVNHPAGRYRFEYVETAPDGRRVLHFYGPIRRVNQKYRRIWPIQLDQIRTVHIKTKET